MRNRSDRTVTFNFPSNSCRLASHVLCSLTAPLLFSSIELREALPTAWMTTDDVRETGGVYRRATKQLPSNPDIATSVRTFILRYGSESLQNSTFGTLIFTTFCRLPHLRHFTFGPIEGWQIFSSLISSNLLAAIHALCDISVFRMLCKSQFYLDSLRDGQLFYIFSYLCHIPQQIVCKTFPANQKSPTRGFICR